MFAVNGFYGHVSRNNLRATVLFSGFLVAFQMIAAVTLLAPLAYLDLAHAPLFPWGYATRYVPIVFVASALIFACCFAGHIASVRSAAGYTEVDRRTNPDLVNLIEMIAIAAGLPMPKVGVVESPALNAFACGLSPSRAVVVLTRGLIETLTDRELAAVVAHEIAHIRNNDIRLMAAANVSLGVLLRFQNANLLSISNWRRALLAVVVTPYLVLAIIGGFLSNAALILARISRLLIASSREFVADAEAVRLTHDPEALISALRRIEGRSVMPGLSPILDAMMIDGAVLGPDANHPSIDERVATLARLSRLPDATMPSPAGQNAAARAVIHRRPAVAPESFAPWRRLVARVTEGTDRNPFGIAKTARHVILVGFGLYSCLQVWAIWQINRTSTAWELKNAAIMAGHARDDAELDRMSFLRPVQARCFTTGPYSVGDRGLYAVHTPDAALVEDFASGDRSKSGESDIVLEHYLAYRIRSIRNVESSAGSDRHKALRDYVAIRENMMETMHRFFGQPGLDYMQRIYSSPEDRRILAALEDEREANPASFGPSNDRLDGEINLLLVSPDDFIPCKARLSSSREAEAMPLSETASAR